MRMTNPKGAGGFTLFELLMVMTICGILAAVGTASFRYVTTANRVSQEINGLLGDMQYARSEALKRGQFVVVCPTNGGTSCLTSNAWSTGWIVFVNVNGDHVVGSGDAILRYAKNLNTLVPSNADTLSGSVSTLTYVMFNREGYADSGSATGTWNSLVLDSTPSNTNWRRCLAVSVTGGLTVLRSGTTLPTTC